MQLDNALKHLEEAMADLYVVRRGIVHALDKNPGTGAYGYRDIRTGRTELCRTLETVDEVHNSLADAISIARRSEVVGYERSRSKACALATNKIHGLPNKTGNK